MSIIFLIAAFVPGVASYLILFLSKKRFIRFLEKSITENKLTIEEIETIISEGER